MEAEDRKRFSKGEIKLKVVMAGHYKSFPKDLIRECLYRGSHQRCSMKKVFLEILQDSQESTCARVSFLMACNFIKKEALAQVFSCEFCESSKNTFFTGHLWTNVSCLMILKNNCD